MASAPAFCPACGAESAGRFCPRCGHAIGAGPSPNRNAWLAAGLVVLLSLVTTLYLVARPPATAAAPDMLTAGGTGLSGPAPSLGNMTPREMFDRLYNRVMTAAEAGDSASVVRLTAHGLAAYDQLQQVDADARYHAAVLHAQVGEVPQALALADTILADSPRHLLGYVIRGTVAQLTGDGPALARARADFLAAWVADPRREKPEYLDHQTVLDEFRKAAEAAKP